MNSHAEESKRAVMPAQPDDARTSRWQCALRNVFALKEGPWRWSAGVQAAFANTLPLASFALAGHLSLGLIASLGHSLPVTARRCLCANVFGYCHSSRRGSSPPPSLVYCVLRCVVNNRVHGRCGSTCQRIRVRCQIGSAGSDAVRAGLGCQRSFGGSGGSRRCLG